MSYINIKKILLVYPEFSPYSFWNYKEVCRLVGARYPAAPLGLITLAALLPNSWQMKLVDMNTVDLKDSDIDEADAILVLDSNIINTHPVAALDLLRVHRSGAAKVFVAGHRSNKLTTQCAQFAGTQPGSEVALLNCLAGLVIEKAIRREVNDTGEPGSDKRLHQLGQVLGRRVRGIDTAHDRRVLYDVVYLLEHL